MISHLYTVERPNKSFMVLVGKKLIALSNLKNVHTDNDWVEKKESLRAKVTSIASRFGRFPRYNY